MKIMIKTLKIAILGFGNAAKSFVGILAEKRLDIKRNLGYEISTVAITTRSRGCLIDSDGIDLKKACIDLEKSGKFDDTWDCYINISSLEVAKEVDYDVLIELTPLEIFSGQPAIDHIKTAMARGKHVITANKGPIAWAFAELKNLAKEKDSLFYYETTVMDGTPIFNLVEDTLKYCKVTEVEGILNSTTNFVLEELALGKDYEEVIAEGQSKGFVEANPAMDIEGWDAAAKTAALLNVLMDANITPMDIDRTGIEGLTVTHIREAATRGNDIKLLCRGYMEDGLVHGVVKPTEVKKSDLLASITGTSSLLSITTDLMGKLSIVEHQPEILQTGYGIFSDLIRVIENMGKKS